MWCFIFGKITIGKWYKWGVTILNGIFMGMHPLEVYYLNQARRGLTTTGSDPHYIQRGHGIGNFFNNLFRWAAQSCGTGPKQWGARHYVPVARNRRISLNATLPTRQPLGYSV